jgi:hypothetical protein
MFYVFHEMQALDAAMKQYKASSPETAAMFFTVDDDNSKILCMSCVPKVRPPITLSTLSTIFLLSFKVIL